MLIKNGKVFLVEKGGFVNSDIRVEGSKIKEISEQLLPQEGEDCLDADGGYITPGLIDAHSHICISEEGMGAVGDDCCDYSGALTPELEVLDGIYPFDKAVEASVRSGVTCACVCPGSDGVVGGVSSVLRLTGTVADQMLVSRYAAMKCSLGENPKAAGHGFASRMGAANQFRKCMEDALDYKHSKEEAEAAGSYFKKERGMEHMLLVLEKKMPIHVHAHRSDDICTAVRLAREYDLNLVIVHGTDAASVADYLKNFDYPVLCGPAINPRSKNEVWNKSYETPGILQKAGIKVCISADHDVTPLYYLSTYAAMAVRYGMDEFEALKAITINPAEVLGIADQKGVLKAGLDADLVIWSDHPFACRSLPVQVLIEGKAMIE